jgi:putative transcriptional regulator
MENEHSRWGEALIQGLKEAIAYQRGELTDVRVYTVEVPARKAHLERPPWYAPFLIREVRQKLSVSQAVFAEMLGVSVSSVRAWEQGRREPEGPVRRLLQIAESHPEVLAEACAPLDADPDAESPAPQSLKVAARPADGERLAADTSAPRKRKSRSRPAKA